MSTSRTDERYSYLPFPVEENHQLHKILKEKGVDPTNSTFVKLADGCLLYKSLSKYVVKKGKGIHSFVISQDFRSRASMHDMLGGSIWKFMSVKRKRAGRPKKAEPKRDKTALGIGLGLHEVEFDNTSVFVLEQEFGQPVSAGGSSFLPMIHRSTLLIAKNTGNERLLQRFLEHVSSWAEVKTKESKIDIFEYSTPLKSWVNVISKRARPLSSVFLPKVVKGKLVKDLTGYLSEEAINWYHLHGIPYKRTYLFYGPPGCGKSSLVQALAGNFSMNICFLQPTGPRFGDHEFQKCIRTAPENSIIVIEDIDSLFDKNRQKKATEHSPLTFSGLLNALDGIGNPDGQVFILTTNHIDRLDPALIRNGRVDLHVEFPLATAEQMKLMFHSFYPRLQAFGAKMFAKDSQAESKFEQDSPTKNDSNQPPSKKQKLSDSSSASSSSSPASSSSSTSSSSTSSKSANGKATEANGKRKSADKPISEEEKNELDNLAEKFAKAWIKRFPKSLPMAAIQQHFILHMRSTAAECVKAVPKVEIYIPKYGSEHTAALYN